MVSKNFDEIEAEVDRLGIHCDLRRTCQLDVAVQLEALAEDTRTWSDAGHDVEFLDRDRDRAEVSSPP